MTEFKRYEKKILSFLTGREKTTTSEIAKLLGIDYYIARFVLEKLESEGLVRKDVKGKRIKYWVKK